MRPRPSFSSISPRPRRALPIVAEEEVAAGRIPRVGAEFFLVDPLDGTKEFIAKRGDFTVNIALIRDGHPVLGVVFAPANEQLFAGDVAAGRAFRCAQKPDRAHTARPRADPRALAAGARHYCSGLALAQQSRHGGLPGTHQCGGPRLGRLIAQVLSGCRGRGGPVSAARPTMEWDTAAGHAVLAAAGGQVTALDGAPLRYGKPEFRNPSFIASGPASSRFP